MRFHYHRNYFLLFLLSFFISHAQAEDTFVDWSNWSITGSYLYVQDSSILVTTTDAVTSDLNWIVPVSSDSNWNVSPVPEPEIYAMMGIGLGLLGWVARRKKSMESAAA